MNKYNSSILTNLKKFFLKKGRFALFFIFYTWIVLFFLIPLLIIAKISFAKVSNKVPPYSNLTSWKENQFNITLNTENYYHIKDDLIYLKSYFQSLKISLISTLLCLIFAYPLAWSCYRIKKNSTKSLMLLFIILPSWVSFLVRVYSLMILLEKNGLINNFLIFFKIINKPINIIYTDTAVYIGSVYCYLPLMVLSIYNALTKIDYLIIEAAYNLGANYLKIFFKIILPLTKHGMMSGIALVSIPNLGEYIIPELLGGSGNIMISRILWQEFFNNHDWPVASALSILIILSFLIPIILINKYKNK